LLLIKSPHQESMMAQWSGTWTRNKFLWAAACFH